MFLVGVLQLGGVYNTIVGPEEGEGQRNAGCDANGRAQGGPYRRNGELHIEPKLAGCRAATIFSATTTGEATYLFGEGVLEELQQRLGRVVVGIDLDLVGSPEQRHRCSLEDVHRYEGLGACQGRERVWFVRTRRRALGFDSLLAHTNERQGRARRVWNPSGRVYESGTPLLGKYRRRLYVGWSERGRRHVIGRGPGLSGLGGLRARLTIERRPQKSLGGKNPSRQRRQTHGVCWDRFRVSKNFGRQSCRTKTGERKQKRVTYVRALLGEALIGKQRELTRCSFTGDVSRRNGSLKKKQRAPWFCFLLVKTSGKETVEDARSNQQSHQNGRFFSGHQHTRYAGKA